jgi:hypothetical protein
MPDRLRVRTLICIIFTLGSLATSCTVIYTVPTKPVVFPPTNKMNMTVVLRLTEELCNAKYERQPTGNHFILPIGSALCMNAEALARAVFTEARIIRDKDSSPGSETDAVLIPSLAAIERDRPATIFSTQTTSVLFNWSLNDTSGAPIWVTTIAGEGKGPMGRPESTSAGLEQTEMVLKDVFQKSFHEMSTSRVIQEFAANRRKLNPK